MEFIASFARESTPFALTTNLDTHYETKLKRKMENEKSKIQNKNPKSGTISMEQSANARDTLSSIFRTHIVRAVATYRAPDIRRVRKVHDFLRRAANPLQHAGAIFGWKHGIRRAAKEYHRNAIISCRSCRTWN